MSLENKAYSTGGNAALMANRLATEGCDVLLGGAVGHTLATLLHPSGKVTLTTMCLVYNLHVCILQFPIFM